MATEIDLMRWMLAIAVTAGLLGVFAYVLKRFNPVLGQVKKFQKEDRQLKIIETLTLDTKRRLVLLDCAGEKRLILMGGQTDIELQPLSSIKGKEDS